MPPLNQPSPLQERCLEIFVNDLYVRCCEIERIKQDNDAELADRKVARLRTRFSKFPSSILRKIIQLAVVEAQERSKDSAGPFKEFTYEAIPTMLWCLLQPPLNEVDLPLVRLKFHLPAEIRYRMSSVFIAAIPTMKNLRILSIPWHGNNDVIKLLSLHCEHLEELDVAWSSIVDDDGLKYLGVVQEPGLHGCRELTLLSLKRCPRVTARTLARLLGDLPDLKRLDHDECVNALKFLSPKSLSWSSGGGGGGGEARKSPLVRTRSAGDADKAKHLRFLRLIHLEQRPEGFAPSEKFLDFLVKCCPDVESMSLVIQKESILAKLPRFPRLTAVSLRLKYSEDGEGFRTFAKSMGPRLISLELRSNVVLPDSIVALGEYCTNLQQLSVTQTRGAQDGVYPENTDAFRNLESLRITTLDGPVCENQWLYLTSKATKLTDLHMEGRANFMTDEFWRGFLANVNNLPELEVLGLRCHANALNMGDESVNAFVETCPKLRRIIGVNRWGKMVQQYPIYSYYAAAMKMIAKKGNLVFELVEWP